MKRLVLGMMFLGSISASANCLKLSGSATDARLLASLETAVMENASAKFQASGSEEDKASLNFALSENVRARSEFLKLCMETLNGDKRNCSKLTALAAEARLVASLETAVIENASAKFQASGSEEDKASLNSALSENTRVRGQFLEMCFSM